MAVNSWCTITIPAGVSYFRITSPTFLTADSAYHVNVVDGQGGVNSAYGARYNYPGVETVYLAEDQETCLAEKMFYFHREVLGKIDTAHLPMGTAPSFNKTFVLWEVRFKDDVVDVFDMGVSGALAFYNVFPSLTTNPSQDYYHLKDKRALLQSNGYQGLRAPSSRTKNGGFMVVLFRDQSQNVLSIQPSLIEIRMITDSGAPFNNHIIETLDFTASEFRVLNSPLGAAVPKYGPWQKIQFNH